MKYNVTFEVFASKTVTVDAESEEEAREKAAGEADISLCWSCDRQIDVSDLGDITNVELCEEEDEEL